MPWELLIAIVLVASIGAMLRPFLRARRAERDYGLLRVIATASSRQAAGAAIARLREHGIRVTTAPSEDGGRLDIMVFPVDEQRAIQLLLEEGWPPPRPD